MRGLCVGDLHLGAGADYGREPGDRLNDLEEVWRRCLQVGVENDVDAVLFAGDAFHRRRPTPAELIAFQRPLQEVVPEHDIEIVAIAGNHDCEAADLPTALDVFGREIDLYTQPGVWEAPGGVQVACLPWTPVSRLVARLNGDLDRDRVHETAARLLVETARGLRERIDGPAVLLTHWSLTGASTPTGVLTDEFRETVVDADELAELGFDAIVAGHIHKAQLFTAAFGWQPVVASDVATFFYTGSPAPIDFGEATTPHGCWILDVGEHGAHVEFVPVASRPFVTIETDGLALSTAGPRVDLCLFDGDDEVSDAVVRVRYEATEEQGRLIDHAAIRRSLLDAGAHKVYAIQPTILRADRARVDGMDEDLAPLAALNAWVAANDIPTDDRAALVDLTAGYLAEATT